MKTLRATSKTAAAVLSDHRVVLIPGFLGFDKLGDYGYFADTVGKALANALATIDVSGRIDVDALETVPAGSLEDRQRKLIDQLREIRQTHPRAQLHLVGHSTGGLDAELLVRSPRPQQQRAPEVDAIRRSIRSVITIAAPLAGTTLALSPLAQLLAIDSPSDLLAAPLSVFIRGSNTLLDALGGIVRLVGADEALAKVVHGALHSGGAGASYALSLLLTRALIDDLAPSNIVNIMAQTHEDPALTEIHRARFLTLARREDSATSAGRLFTLLYDLTDKQPSKVPGEELVRQRIETDRARIPVIGKLPPPDLKLGANDGIVNTFLQVLPCTQATVAQEVKRVAALVIADHLDVVGYYPGKDGRANGFLSSGSDFRDAAFDALYAAVAKEIARSIGLGPRARSGRSASSGS